MEAESNRGFHNEDINSSMSRHAISFQHGGMNNNINSMSEMVPMGNYFGLSSSSGIMYPGNSSFINNSSNHIVSQQGGGGNPSGSSSSSLLLDSVPGLKHDTGLAVEWSLDEQYRLEEGLANYANEPSIMKYIKIAAVLPDKTVRDVALRCRWLTRKRRKSEEHSTGKKINYRKDKPVELPSQSNLHSALPPSMGSYSHMSRIMGQSQRTLYDGICGPMKQLMEQNAQTFNQISANLSTYKLQDNIDLFCHTRHNINTILNDMSEMPGIMSQMPPLPVAINEDLARIKLASICFVCASP
ncbi:hypothetical protein TSUD_91270 [Trifolium subterraneum]|uniref:Myb-like domain-containing protein n=1 Tax=Trifolium subterraneum TaxID=3900 RepID=A0A2Z6NKJ3_TRISU|nr:hypothetical protein TSUD_91270 [Trifolium subterraneum]